MTKTKKKWLIPVIAASLILATVLGVVLFLCLREKTTADGRFDYLNSDMTRYIKLDEDDYKGIVAEISKDYEITEETVEAEVEVEAE